MAVQGHFGGEDTRADFSYSAVIKDITHMMLKSTSSQFR